MNLQKSPRDIASVTIASRVTSGFPKETVLCNGLLLFLVPAYQEYRGRSKKIPLLSRLAKPRNLSNSL
jgi:hypothetical protein